MAPCCAHGASDDFVPPPFLRPWAAGRGLVLHAPDPRLRPRPARGMGLTLAPPPPLPAPEEMMAGGPPQAAAWPPRPASPPPHGGPTVAPLQPTPPMAVDHAVRAAPAVALAAQQRAAARSEAKQVCLDALAQLDECGVAYCPFNRQRRPHVRRHVEATIARAVLDRAPGAARLHLTFVGTAGFAAELSCLMQLRRAGDRPLALTFVEWGARPLIDAVAGPAAAAPPALACPASLAHAAAQLGHVGTLLGILFRDVRTRLVACHADLLAAAPEAAWPPCHAVICMDPGACPAIVAGARFSAAAIAVFAGAPACLTALAAVDHGAAYLCHRHGAGPSDADTDTDDESGEDDEDAPVHPARLRLSEVPPWMRAALPSWPHFAARVVRHAADTQLCGSAQPLAVPASPDDAFDFVGAAEGRVILDQQLTL